MRIRRADAHRAKTPERVRKRPKDQTRRLSCSSGGVDRAQLLARLGELGCLQRDRLPLDLRR
jgi:hypothetical protein